MQRFYIRCQHGANTLPSFCVTAARLSNARQLPCILCKRAGLRHRVVHVGKEESGQADESSFKENMCRNWIPQACREAASRVSVLVITCK